MNEQLQSKLLEYLNSGEAFIKSQAPEFVNQALTYYAWEAHLMLYVGLALLAAGLAFGVLAYAAFNVMSYSEGLGVVSMIASVTLAVTGTINSVYSYSTIKQIEMAPKIFLVEKLTGRHCN